jgi:hypothetical protein
MGLPRSIEPSAPSVLLLPVVTTSFVGMSTWPNATAIYNVGSPVDPVDTLSVSGTRGGALALTNANFPGGLVEYGFTLEPGAFQIMK